MLVYHAFGLQIRSNVPLPGLDLATSSAPAASLPLRIRLETDPAAPGPDGRTLFEGELEDGVPELVVDEIPAERSLRLRYADGTRFVVDGAGTEVWGGVPPALTIEDAATYLLGPVLSLVLRLRGTLCLHAAVVSLGGGAVAIAGAPESGKSTLAAALALRGHRVLSDDVAPLLEHGGAFAVPPTSPRVRLWEDSVDRMFGSPSALPRLTPGWDKRYLDLAERDLFERRPLPLRAVLVLDARVDEARAPRVETLRPGEAFEAALAQLHTVWMFPSLPQAPVFELATRLARAVPMLRLVPHADPGRLEDLCETVEEAVDV